MGSLDGMSIHPPGEGFHYAGDYSAVTTYNLNDVVSYTDGNTYISLVGDNLNNTPDVSPADWALFTAAGAAGAVGPTGPSGASITGPSGESITGPTGPTGSKTAILELDRKWRGLSCVESPETRFEDLICTEITGNYQKIMIDPLMVEACEPGSIKIRSVHSERCGLGYSSFKIDVIKGDPMICVNLDRMISGLLEEATIPVTICISGIRKGHVQRFPIFTAEQAMRNAEFWAQAHKARK